jgi:hypothetical protein
MRNRPWRSPTAENAARKLRRPVRPEEASCAAGRGLRVPGWRAVGPRPGLPVPQTAVGARAVCQRPSRRPGRVAGTAVSCAFGTRPRAPCGRQACLKGRWVAHASDTGLAPRGSQLHGVQKASCKASCMGCRKQEPPMMRSALLLARGSARRFASAAHMPHRRPPSHETRRARQCRPLSCASSPRALPSRRPAVARIPLSNLLHSSHR